jgi:hypothetical protein
MRVLRVALCILAIASPFFFPWPYTMVLGLAAALFFPPIALIVGVLVDTLYFNGSGLPLFTLYGIVGAGGAYVVQQFVKNRIM